jgi:hypothetical protein
LPGWLITSFSENISKSGSTPNSSESYQKP